MTNKFSDILPIFLKNEDLYLMYMYRECQVDQYVLFAHCIVQWGKASYVIQ